MSPARSRWIAGLWVLTGLAALWAAVGDQVVTRLAYAVQGGPPQATDQEQAGSAAELPEVQAVSRAFKLVARAARPGVVHIRVSGGDQGWMSDQERKDFIREHLRQWLEQEPRDESGPPSQPQPPDRSDDEHQRRIREQLKDFLDQEQLDRLDRERQERLNEHRQQLEHMLERMPPPPGSGSGIVLDREGYILTNSHVVRGRTGISVVLHDEREYQAKLIGTDSKTDLAVLKIEVPDLHPLTFGNSDQIEVGDWVLAVGSPFGLTQTVTHGIVSAKGRTRVAEISIAYQEFIQTDAAVNPGNSGGPLLNLRGEVIGVNTAIATQGEAYNAGIAFAIPSNRAAHVARQLRTAGTVSRGWLGVHMSPVEPADVEIFGLPSRQGVLIDRVFEDSPADQAGLQVEDVVLTVDQAPVEGLDHLRGLVADLEPGEVARLRVVRDGRQLSADVRLGLQPENLQAALLSPSADARRVPRLGLFARTFRPTLIGQYRLAYDAAVRGVLVWRVDPALGSSVDLQQRELIVACNDKPVTSVHDLNELLKDVPAGESVRLRVLEAVGDQRIITVKIIGN